MKWSSQQSAALDRVAEWLESGTAPFFYLAGYAGTGKTTLAKHFADGVGDVLFGSFTGKAASVMRSKGCTDATTIHRLIYRSRDKGTKNLKDLQKELEEAPEEAKQGYRVLIRKELESLKAPAFTLNEESPVRNAGLVVIDECSMVSGRIADDLMSFGTPILVLGDPAQLPPVHGKGFFTAGNPDIMLTEVHRQARESGILALATEIREGGKLYLNKWHDCEVIEKGDLDPNDVPSYDQVLVGTNKKRAASNVRMRELIGRTSELPEPGDRLVCLKNNHELGLLNGEIWNTLSAMILDDDRIMLTIENDEDSMSIVAWRHPFEGRELDYWGRKNDVQEFDFGYVLTVHKAQGSQWPRVLVFDESYIFRQNAAKHLYTAITRASNYLTVVM